MNRVAQLKQEHNTRWLQAKELFISQPHQKDRVFKLLEALTTSADIIINKLVQEYAINDAKVSIVAVGGYARQQMFPYSDLDLLILHSGELTEEQKEIIAKFTSSLWDIGFAVGVQLSNITEVSYNIENNDVMLTSYIDNRFLGGDPSLFEIFQEQLKDSLASKGKAKFLSAKIHNAKTRADVYNDSLFYLEPHIKEGKGGVRDINTIWWISTVYYGVKSLCEIKNVNFLKSDEFAGFYDAVRFIFEIRAELHYIAKRKFDIMRREYQPLIAESFDFKPSERYIAVENFMHQYYLSVKKISSVTEFAMDRISTELSRTNVTPPKVTMLSGGVVRYDNTLGLLKKDINQMSKIISLIRRAAETGLSIHPTVIEIIKSEEILLSDDDIASTAKSFGDTIALFPHSLKVTKYFLKTTVLHKLIPEFADIAGRMQYNTYHHYTVDEHTLIALSAVDKLYQSDSPALKSLKDTLYNLPRKDLLALAILLHDIGKSTGKNHAISGADIAKTVLTRFRFSDEDINLVAHIIKNHLLMSSVAQRRDLHSREEIYKFVKEVSSPLALDILYILTYADMNALGGKKFSRWHAGLLEELYSKSKDMLILENDTGRFNKSVKSKKQMLSEMASNDPFKMVIVDELDDETVYYMSTDTLISYINLAAKMKKTNKPAINIEYLDKYHCYRATVCAEDDFGLLQRIVGGISSLDCNIMGAQIITTKGKTAIDSILFNPINDISETDNWLGKVEESIINAINGKIFDFSKLKNKYFTLNNNTHAKINIKFENTYSDQYTIIDIFAPDRVGALYNLLGILHQNNINVYHAKISTDVDVIVDSFYVTDKTGCKITDPALIEFLKTAISNILI